MSFDRTPKFNLTDALAELDEKEAAEKEAAINALLAPAVALFNERCAGPVALADGRLVNIASI